MNTTLAANLVHTLDVGMLELMQAAPSTKMERFADLLRAESVGLFYKWVYDYKPNLYTNAERDTLQRIANKVRAEQ